MITSFPIVVMGVAGCGKSTIARRLRDRFGLGTPRLRGGAGAVPPYTAYGLVATYNCLHDMGDPVAAARHIRSVLSDDGIWLTCQSATCKISPERRGTSEIQVIQSND